MQLDESWRLWPHTYAQHCSGKTWTPYPYLRYISIKLEERIRKGNGRIILNLPPRHGKSEFISKWLCSWYLDTYPKQNIILTCYGDELASGFGRAVRNHLQENQYSRAKIKSDSAAANRFDTTFGGTMITAGIGGAITGRGGHLLVCDDPYKNWEEASSENYRKKVKDWWDTTFKTRQEPGATIILLMTRWHHDDLASTLEKDEKEKWEVINFPAIAEIYDEIGRKPGDALCPERYNEQDLAMIQNGLPDQHWQSLYQQRPSSLNGDIFKTEWWQYYDVMPNNIIHKVQFWDTAQKPGITNDWSVCATYGFTANSAYLLDLWRNKVAAPDLEDAIKANYNTWKPEQVVIEDKSSGASAIQYIQKFTQIPVLPVTPTKDKVLRAIEATPYLRAKKLYIPRHASWVKDYLKEHNEFPNAAHDDQCFIAGTKIATLFGDIPIEKIKINDFVITPFGLRKVLACGQTGYSTVINKLGLTATSSHKVFNYNKFDHLSCINNSNGLSFLKIKEVIKWKYLKSLYLMKQNTEEWAGRESIIYLKQNQMKVVKNLKDFMLLFGSFIQERKLKKVFMFIIRMGIHLIMTILILNVYHLSNMVKFQKILICKKLEKILTKLDIFLLNGINQKKEENGIVKMLKNLLLRENKYLKNVFIVTRNLIQNFISRNIATINAQNIIEEKVPVFNLTIEEDGVYYANKILVSNCDTTSMMVNYVHNLSTYQPRIRQL